MDRNGQPTLTRPATPQAFRVAGGRYSFIHPEGEAETVALPARLREEKITIRELRAAKR